MKLFYIFLSFFVPVYSLKCEDNEHIIHCRNRKKCECANLNTYCTDSGLICRPKWNQLKKLNFQNLEGICRKRDKFCSIKPCMITLSPVTFHNISPSNSPTFSPSILTNSPTSSPFKTSTFNPTVSPSFKSTEIDTQRNVRYFALLTLLVIPLTLSAYFVFRKV